MLRFRCPNCGQRLVARRSQAGWIKTCPRCKRKIAVPERTRSEAARAPSNGEMPGQLHPRQPPNHSAGTAPDERTEPAPTGSEPPGKFASQPPFPRPADVLLYPLRPPALFHLLCIVGLPLAMNCGENLGIVFAHQSSFAYFTVGLYTYWYVAKCVDVRAQGQTHSPKATDRLSDLDEVWYRFLYLGGTYILCLFPVSSYYFATQQLDWHLVIFAIWAIASFPMTLLAALVLDSFRAFNPLFLLRSIFRTLAPYTCLVALFAVLALMACLSYQELQDRAELTFLGVAWTTAVGYAALALGHVLGWSYRHNEERLDWDI